MLIIPIDKLKNKGGIGADPIPKMRMQSNGQILLNVTAVKTLNIKTSIPIFMHFYKSDNDLFVKIDNDKTHSVRFIYNEKTSLCKGYSRTTIKYFFDLFDAKSKIEFKIKEDDFGKFKIIKIIAS
jgi:hypothetical protein